MTTPNRLPPLVSVPKGYAPLNETGLDLANLAAWHQQNIQHAGILAAAPENANDKPLGSEANPAVTSQRPWITEPMGSIPFDEPGGLTLGTTPTPGNDQPVLKMTCPQGFDGVIKFISNNISDTTFENFSGNLVWKILINGRPTRNFGNIQAQKGTVSQGRMISPIRIFSGDIITYTVQYAAGTVAGQVVCSLTGYYYPSRGIS